MLRYERNIMLEDIGISGQEKLQNSRVLVIGCGGLGSPCALYLAASGVGKIGLCDFDVVEESNLNRQILHTTFDIGRDKTRSAKEKLTALNPEITIETHQEFSRQILKNYDFIVDATDNFAAKFLINAACVAENRAFCHAGVLRYVGQCLTVLPKKSACVACVFENPENQSPDPKNVQISAFKAGLFGALPGVFGVIQAHEAIKFCLKKHENLTNTLLTCDIRTFDFCKISVTRKKSCKICGDV